MPQIPLPQEILGTFCKKWKIQELSVFGSFARGEAGPESDLDLLVTFAPDAKWSLFDHMRMEDELSELSGRPVELVSRKAIEDFPNPVRRAHILGQAETVYVAG